MEYDNSSLDFQVKLIEYEKKSNTVKKQLAVFYEGHNCQVSIELCIDWRMCFELITLRFSFLCILSVMFDYQSCGNLLLTKARKADAQFRLQR